MLILGMLHAKFSVFGSDMRNEERSSSVHDDSLMRMKSYALAIALVPDAWADACRLSRCVQTRQISAQLYRAVGSIAANIAEGYSRSSGKDRARLFEYALGSARECLVWYELARPLLGDIVGDRLAVLARIRALLLATIPRERPITIRKN